MNRFIEQFYSPANIWDVAKVIPNLNIFHDFISQKIFQGEFANKIKTLEEEKEIDQQELENEDKQKIQELQKSLAKITLDKASCNNNNINL